MDASILLRLGPAVAVAVVVAMLVDPARRLARGEAFDEVVRFLLVALVVGRAWWLLVGGPEVWRGLLSTIVLVRAGIATGVGVLAAMAWVLLRDAPAEDRRWRLVAIVPSALAGGAVWQVMCQVEGVCGGVPVDWGITFPGRAVPSFPIAWAEALVLLALLVVGLRRRGDAAWWWLLGALAALARVGLGFLRPALTGFPNPDQLAFVAVAAACLAVRHWLVKGPAEVEGRDEAVAS